MVSHCTSSSLQKKCCVASSNCSGTRPATGRVEQLNGIRVFCCGIYVPQLKKGERGWNGTVPPDVVVVAPPPKPSSSLNTSAVNSAAERHPAPQPAGMSTLCQAEPPAPSHSGQRGATGAWRPASQPSSSAPQPSSQQEAAHTAARRDSADDLRAEHARQPLPKRQQHTQGNADTPGPEPIRHWSRPRQDSNGGNGARGGGGRAGGGRGGGSVKGKTKSKGVVPAWQSALQRK